MNKGIFSCINFVVIYTETPQQRLRIRKLNHKFIKRPLTTTPPDNQHTTNLLRGPKNIHGLLLCSDVQTSCPIWKLQKIILQNTVVAHTVQVQSQPVDSLRNKTTKCLIKNLKSIWTCDVSSPKDSTITSPYATGIFQASLTCSTCYYYMF